MADELPSVSSNEFAGGVGDVPGSQVELSEAEGGGEQAAVPEPVDPAFLSRAGEYNLTEEDLRTLPRATVERIIAGADRRMLDTFRREQPQYPAQQYQPQYPVHSQQGGQAPPQFFDPFDVQFDKDDEPAEPIVKNMKAMKDWAEKQLSKVHGHYEQRLQVYEQAIGAINRQNDYAVLDRFIDGLGQEWSGVFGKGPSLDMDPRSQEFLKRDDLRTAAIEVMQLHQHMTGRSLPASEALRRAQYAQHTEKAFAADRARQEAKTKQALAATTDRPKPTGAPKPVSSIRDRAVQMAKVGLGQR